MVDRIKLKHPIQIDGKLVHEITVNTDDITAALYAEADTKKRIAAGTKNVAIVPAVEFDFGFHPYIGFAAAIAANPGYTFEDLERVHGMDVIAFGEVGRNFLLQSEDAPSKTSDEQSATTAENSTQAPSNSNESAS